MADSNKRTRLQQSTNSIPHAQQTSFVPPIRTSNTSVITVQSTSPQSMLHHHYNQQQQYNSQQQQEKQLHQYLQHQPHMQQTTEMSLDREDVNNVDRYTYENEHSNGMQQTFNEIPASVQTTVPVDAALEEELDRWGLDEELKTNLRAMTPNTRREIINDIVREQQILHASQYIQNNNNINIFDRRSNTTVNPNNYNNNNNEQRMSDNFMSSDQPQFVFDFIPTLDSRGNWINTINGNNNSGDEEDNHSSHNNLYHRHSQQSSVVVEVDQDNNNNNNNSSSNNSIDSEVEEHEVNSQINNDEWVNEMTRNNNNEQDGQQQQNINRLLPIGRNHVTNHNANSMFSFIQSIPSHQESSRQSRRPHPRRTVMWRRVNPNDGQVPFSSPSRWPSQTGREINSNDPNRQQQLNRIFNNPAVILSQLFSRGHSGRQAGLQNLFTVLAQSVAQNDYGLLQRDVDDMTYEQLLELQERIGKVNKGLTPQQIQAVLCQVTHLPRNERCVICLQDFIPQICSPVPISDVNTASSTHHNAKSRNNKKPMKQQKTSSTLTQQTRAQNTHQNDTNNSHTFSNNNSVKLTNDNDNNLVQDNDNIKVHAQQTSLHSSSLSEKCVQIISCGHVFHKQCIEQWLRNNKTCPVCNQEIPIYKQGNKV